VISCSCPVLPRKERREDVIEIPSLVVRVEPFGEHHEDFMPVESGAAASPSVLALRERLSGFETERGRLSGLDFRCANPHNPPQEVQAAETPRPCFLLLFPVAL